MPDATTGLPSLYEQFIHLSRYARWLPEEARRETWPETVDRYMNYMCDIQCPGLIPDEVRTELRTAILNLEVMPSMRAMMTAGPALARDAVSAYNCAYVAIDNLVAFDEMLYLLMCGTGVGFSVERQFINELPRIPEKLRPSKSIITVEDSRIGWANALRELTSMLSQGRIPTWDMTLVRPKGARLHTFGGRASGPEPLEDLFNFIIDKFKNAAGRRLQSIECHDICCKIGEIVVAGGVRRSAEISLNNPSDDRMRHAKSGQWWDTEPQRQLANNSACYTEKPDMSLFMREWLALYESKSGERGIFNREAAKNQVLKYGRRDAEHEFGTNPCVTANTWVMTTNGPKQVSDLIDTPFTAIVQGQAKPCPTGFVKTGTKQVYLCDTDRGYALELTDNHKLLHVWKQTRKTQYSDWVALEDLVVGDVLATANHSRTRQSWPGSGTFDSGYVLGQLVGDGGFTSNAEGVDKGYMRFWGESSEHMAKLALERMSSEVLHRSDVKPSESQANGYLQVGCKGLAELAKSFGICRKTKKLGTDAERTSSEFHRGFIRGFFDADGSVQGDIDKGVSVRLSQADLGRLQVVQRMLSRLGIACTIYRDRRPAGYFPLPDGRGGVKEYYCKTMHELVISNDNIQTFRDVVGFDEPAKVARLDYLLANYSRTPNRERFTATITRITATTIEDVYDCTVPGVHEFDGNGIRAHNCSEIILRSMQFCNLTEVIVRPTDTPAKLKRKVKLATILGTIQSTIANFRYLRPEWQANTEEECLLGVSMTGILDNDFMAGRSGKRELAKALDELREYAVKTNKTWAKKLGVNQSTAVTCVKPSGTVSQLVNCASGIHPRFSPYYTRTVRAANTDPLATMMKDKGFPWEDDVSKPEQQSVFSFPIKSPDHAIVAEGFDAIQQLELWKLYQAHWCEHKVSMTAYVHESEWMKVGSWVWDNFDVLSGVSFLPAQSHTYRQAPYQECTQEEYEALKATMPADINWSDLKDYETDDEYASKGAREYACTGGSCDIVDLTT